jgi:hypothetical protein
MKYADDSLEWHDENELVRRLDVVEAVLNLADTLDDVVDVIMSVPTYKADRKTESNSEKPNNCEVKNYCDDCLYTDTCDSKEFFYACTSKATISKMEQVEDKTKTQMKTQNSNLTFEKADEPQTSGVVWTENEMPIYHSTTASTDEPQTKYKKWETKPNVDIPTENTTCVGVAMALIEDEPTEDMWLNDADDERWSENEPQTDVYDYLGNGKWERR